MKKLEHQVAVITGAGSGIGKAIAELFAAEGCAVIAADINPEKLDQLSSTIKAQGGMITTIQCNMVEESEIDHLINSAIDIYGRIDILINNAGVMDNFQPIGEVDNTTWDRVMSVNVTGPFKAIRKIIPVFLNQQKGNIINIASLGGLKGAIAGAAYTTSKHALIGLTKNTGYVYGNLGIRCNAIAPGAVMTSIGDTIDMSAVSPLAQQTILKGMVLNPKNGSPTELAEVALFLASDASSFVNGTVLVADGGWNAA
jgi:NAD(P)-dependent dehydrogenase (short-subunit alcohol dehydrogenase family)